MKHKAYSDAMKNYENEWNPAFAGIPRRSAERHREAARRLYALNESITNG